MTMKNIYLWLTCLIAVTLAVIPPVDWYVRNPPNELWLWMVLIAATAGVATIFIKTHMVVKVIAVGALVNCFFSCVPYESFTSYVNFVLCCYLYIMASRINNWSILFKAIQSIVILDLLIFFMQSINHDPLLNFGYKQVQHFGTLGQHMQMASFGIVISALLINFTKLNFITAFLYAIFCKSSWGFVCAGVGICVNIFNKQKVLSIILILLAVGVGIVWGFREHKVASASGRIPIWQQTIRLSNEHPLIGWGIGSYKDVFFPLSKLHCFAWREAHDFIFQLCFEVGYVATGCVLVGLGWLFWALWKDNLWLCLSGLAMVTTDALVHFPDRMLQTVPLIIIFLAYCAYSLRKDSTCPYCTHS